MNAPRTAELLIFDLDGTLFQSAKANFEGMKKVFSGMNLQIHISERNVAENLGKPSEQFYRSILPPGKFALWKKIRANIRKEYYPSISRHGRLFPGVIETLGALKRRGYKLALYSNCSVDYFNAAIKALKIRGYFDYAECVQENGLTKTALVKKISSRFSNPKAAVIGDRESDLEAAKRNDALSIGALYGYGKSEAKKADISIGEFAELAAIFDRRLPIFERVLSEISRKKQKGRAFVVGITGIDTSGKTMFAEAFANFLKSRKCRVQAISVDDFHNQREIRYSGKNQADNYYNKSFDYATIAEKLLIPVHRKRSFIAKLTLLNLHTDRYETKKSYAFDGNTIVVFEGVFLFRKELAPYIDYRVFLEIPPGESKRRAKARDVPIYGKEVLRKYDAKYLPAQKRYLRQFPPSRMADIVIDNCNFERPKIK
ncbi:MAG: HAD hydrolase-like protein [Candidatus Micrarchaeota archaeon]|nr:HAD hydrolase-like protein [Candidatus Micrarchaeota archaeon]